MLRRSASEARVKIGGDEQETERGKNNREDGKRRRTYGEHNDITVRSSVRFRRRRHFEKVDNKHTDGQRYRIRIRSKGKLVTNTVNGDNLIMVRLYRNIFFLLYIIIRSCYRRPARDDSDPSGRISKHLQSLHLSIL